MRTRTNNFHAQYKIFIFRVIDEKVLIYINFRPQKLKRISFNRLVFLVEVLLASQALHDSRTYLHQRSCREAACSNSLYNKGSVLVH